MFLLAIHNCYNLLNIIILTSFPDTHDRWVKIFGCSTPSYHVFNPLKMYLLATLSNKLVLSWTVSNIIYRANTNKESFPAPAFPCKIKYPLSPCWHGSSQTNLITPTDTCSNRLLTEPPPQHHRYHRHHCRHSPHHHHHHLPAFLLTTSCLPTTNITCTSPSP